MECMVKHCQISQSFSICHGRQLWEYKNDVWSINLIFYNNRQNCSVEEFLNNSSH